MSEKGEFSVDCYVHCRPLYPPSVKSKRFQFFLCYLWYCSLINNIFKGIYEMVHCASYVIKAFKKDQEN